MISVQSTGWFFLNFKADHNRSYSRPNELPKIGFKHHTYHDPIVNKSDYIPSNQIKSHEIALNHTKTH